MNIKELVKLFIPPIFVKLWRRLFVTKPVGGLSTICNITRNSENLIVIGNGPSLLDSVKELNLEGKDCIVVNHFCETNLYSQIKPRYYLLADPAYWGNIGTYADWLRSKILRFIDSFVNKTTWDINLIVPSTAMGSEFLERIKDNKFIHVYFLNMKNSASPTTLQEKFEAWDSNLIAPPAQTCLNACVWLGIFLRYKRIYLIGADTTWIEQVHVDQETNEVYTIDSHFYGEKKIPLYADVEGKIPQKLHDELICISRALSYYWDLKYYADYADVHIFNASKYSLIDAYERKKEIN